MTEFTKTKMHFTLALLGTLFALHPFVTKIEDYGFDYEFYYGFESHKVWVKIFYPYVAIFALLALTVYFFAVSMRTERQGSLSEKVGNFTYSLAAMILPLYGGLFLISLLAEQMGQAEGAWLKRLAPWVPLVLGALWLLVSTVVAWRVRRTLSDHDRHAKIEQFTHQETTALDRAPELFDDNHYDLSVIESWKALEARLRRALMLRGHVNPAENAEAVIGAASRAGLLSVPAQKTVHDLRNHWHVAISTEPVSKEAAESALKATRDVLSTIPLVDVHKTGK
jgi:hypothetical protein